MENLMPIGGENGVLPSAWVDPDSGAYDAVYRWIKEQGREASGSSREIYLAGPRGVEQVQIAVPLA